MNLKNLRKRLSGLILTCLIALNLPLNAAAAIGPGEDMLNTQDPYGPYQWALKNDGTLSTSEKQIDFFSLGEFYFHRGDLGVDEFLLPDLGPENFKYIVTTAVPGVDINIEEAWELYEQAENKKNVTIALIDTGIDLTHEDLTNAFWVNEDEIPGDGIDNDGNGFIDDINGWNFIDNNNVLTASASDAAHATHAAGTIAATHNTIGISGMVDTDYIKIMPIKALGGSSLAGQSDTIISAIRYAEANGATICNLSIGSISASEAFRQTISESKMLFIVSAGNGNSIYLGYDIDQAPVYPASLPDENIISVANLMFNGELHPSSNYGAASVDIAAPGTMIMSAIPNNRYASMTGTSMAAPIVSAAAAMLSSARPDLSLMDVKNILLATAKPLEALNGLVLTNGMLDVGAALRASR